MNEIGTSAANTYRPEIIASTLHRLKVPVGVIVAGNSNVGKTAVIRKLFVEAIGIDRYGEYFEESIHSHDQPDVTQHISQLPYGTGATGQEDTDNNQGILLYDTPGLDSDYRHIDNIARVALGMPQRPIEEEIHFEDAQKAGLPLKTERQGTVLAAVPFDLFSLAEEQNAPATFVRKMIPVDDATKIINNRELTCIYVVNGADRSLARLPEQVNHLRERFEDKVIFVKTFRDHLAKKEWEKDRIERRERDLNNILGEKSIWVNGDTGEGIDSLAHAVLSLHGYTGAIAEHLPVEAQCKRLLTASQEIPGLIIPAVFSNTLEADTQLTHVLSVLSQFVIHVMYTEDPSNDPGIQSVQESLQQFTEELKESEVKSETRQRTRDPRTLWESFQSLFGTLTETYQFESLSRTPEALAKCYYWVYTLIYERERKEDNCIIKGSMVTETQGVKWFVDQFRPYENFFSENSPWELYRAVGADALTKFWETHHPEVLPVYKPTHVREES